MSLTSGALPHGVRALMQFWFGEISGGFSPDAQSALWYAGTPETDEAIRQRFGFAVEAALDGGYGDWVRSPEGRLGLILLLDQFPRNLYRGQVRAFAGDARALGLVLEGLDSGVDALLQPVQRLFFYMPLEHSEDIAQHRRHIGLLERMRGRLPAEQRHHVDNALQWAHQHAEIVERFGRYPHRNAALGRETTAEEEGWLAEGGARFGQ
ncbi:MAG: DUF924 domain-containing protein [Gammaproteobacteria bacterium AqS3]|nr:DUF924 domain-containing protein [Gammaproteobacteria bacterium AqS3]